MSIDDTAIVEDGAQVAASAHIGPFCRVGPDVTIGEDVVLRSHVVVEGATAIGAGTIVHPFAALGGPPQHLGYKGQKTKLSIGERNVIREHVTFNVGTEEGRGETIIGDAGFFMVGAHVAHDCVIGDRVIFANNATLGGHVAIEDDVFLGGLCAIHQHCRVGAFAFIGGCAAVPNDVIPYGSAIGNHAELAGLNVVGMKRRGVERAVIHDLRDAYRTLFSSDGAFSERLARVEERFGHRDEVRRIVDFIRADTRRPLMGPRR